MSRKQPKKSESQKPAKADEEAVQDDSDELESEELESEEVDDDEPEDDEDEIDDEDEDDEPEEDEFSLDQLSQAYAEVLKERAGESTGDAPPQDRAPDEDPEEPESAEDSQTEKPTVDDDAACPISPESIIESILFVGCPKDVKLNSRKVAAVLRDVSPKEVTKIVRSLNARYEKEGAAFRIESDGGVFKMIVDPQLVEFQQEFFGRNRQVRLSQSVIDVMAVVAYNQPCTRAQIEKIRSKPCGGVLAQLIKREILSVEPGETDPKIKYYSTTDRFLDLFSLEELADLPQSHEVSDIEELAD